MTHGSLFSGIGGFDLAAEWMGWDNIFHCEWNEFGKQVLHHYWPQAISYHDITKTNFSVHRGQIDIISGGFPCQPYSAAGKRLGKEDDRHLWPDMLRTIREVQPRWVVGENVRGLVNWNDGLVFDEVQSDLEAEGFEVTPFILPACAVNAPHRRDRVWFVAYCKNHRSPLSKGTNERTKYQPHHRNKVRATFNTNGSKRNASDTDSQRLKEQGEQSLGGSKGDPKWGVLQRNATDTNCRGLEGTTEVGRNCVDVEWEGIVGDATDTDTSGLKAFNTSDGNLGRSHKAKAFGRNGIKPMHSRKRWDCFPSQSPVCGGDDGIPRELDAITFPKWRKESIKAYGNAIVPQVAFQIFQAIAAYEARRT